MPRTAQIEYVMREVHEGHCENYAGGRSLVKTLIRAGYYWPKVEEDAEIFVAECDKCQRYDNNMHRPAKLLHTVISPWPFMKWGMDIVGPLPQAKGKVRFLLVLTDYFSKWVEAGAFKQKRLEESKGKWPEVLPGVLWAYRMTTKTDTGETLFLLAYGTEALIPVEIDLLEKKREAALIRMAAQKQIIERYYNRKAHLRYFKIGDFVLKKVFQTTKATGAGKLSQNWKGPYKIQSIARKWAYELETMEGKVLP
nr:uncharacterized protein LOC117281855 [Nicotiana tomentosiformis]